MRPTVVPALIDALVVSARAALPAVEVFDGFPAASTSRDWLAVGVTDPMADRRSQAASSTIEWAGATRGVGRDEDGYVVCVAYAHHGSVDAKTARDAVMAIVEVVDQLLRDGAVSVPGVWRLGLTSIDLDQDQTESGAEALAVLRVGYKARI